MTSGAESRAEQIEQELLDLVEWVIHSQQEFDTKLAAMLTRLRIGHGMADQLGPISEDDLPF